MLIGLEGAIRANLLSGEIEVRRNGFNELSTLFRFPRANGHGDGDGHQADNLLAVMRGNAEPLAGIGEALRGSISCLAAEEAMRRGQVLDVRPIWQEAGMVP
jgi:hypothetical protein